MAIRKALGGALIRLGRRIARPTVTVEPMRFRDDVDMHALIGDLNRMSRVYAQDYLQRRESRGWN